MDINKLLKKLENLIKRDGLETAVIPGGEMQIGDTLRTLLPVSESGDAAVLEIMAGPLTDDMYMLQIYTTIILEIGPGCEALKDVLEDWNLTCAIGAYGIYREKRQFYHKYNYPLSADADTDRSASEILTLLCLIQAVISSNYEDAVKLSGRD